MNTKDAHVILTRVKHLEDELQQLDRDLEAARRDVLKLTTEAGASEARRRLDGGASTEVAKVRRQLADRRADVEILEAARPTLEEALVAEAERLAEAEVAVRHECRDRAATIIAKHQTALREWEEQGRAIVAKLQALDGLPGVPHRADPGSPLRIPSQFPIGGIDVFQIEPGSFELRRPIEPDADERARIEQELGASAQAAREAARLLEVVHSRASEQHRREQAAKQWTTTRDLGGEA